MEHRKKIYLWIPKYVNIFCFFIYIKYILVIDKYVLFQYLDNIYYYMTYIYIYKFGVM